MSRLFRFRSSTIILSPKKTKCLYRSIDGTHTDKNTPEMPVPVPCMDLYGHLPSIVAISHFYNFNFLNIFVLYD